MPRISVIMAVYRMAAYLECCLRSISGQSFSNFEVICVDDCSDDESTEILRRFCADDPRFRWFANPRRMGGGASRNRAFVCSRGEYVYFMDPDDILHPRMLECVVYFAEREKADAVSFQYRGNVEFSSLTKLSRPLKKLPFRLENQPFFRMGCGGRYRVAYTYWTKVYRRSVLNGVSFLEGTPDNPHILSDFHHTAVALYGVHRCVLLREALYSYTRNPGSETQTQLTSRHIQNYHAAILDLFARLGGNTDHRIRRYLRDYPFSSVVRSQFRRLRRLRLAAPESYPAARAEFRRELLDLRRRGLLARPGWRNIREWVAVYWLVFTP